MMSLMIETVIKREFQDNEKGGNHGEIIRDVFNRDGAFIARKSLPKSFGIKSKKNLFYCVREKDSGYKELVVYKMRWE